MAQCKISKVDVAIGYDGQTYHEETVEKDDFTIIVILCDIAVIILYIAFYNRLEEQQN